MNKVAAKSAALSGVVFALLMAGFDVWDEESFSVGAFVFRFLFFGGIMFLSRRYSMKKQAKEQQNKN